MHTQSNPKILLAAALLVLVSLACNYARAVIAGNGPTPQLTFIPARTPTHQPAHQPTLTPDSAAVPTEIQQQVESASATAAPGGPVELTFTEKELTAIAAAGAKNQPDATVSNIQVHLQNGRISITGDADQGGFGLTLPFNVVMTVTVSPQGKPVTHVVSASAGPFPIPQSYTDQIAAQINQSIIDQVATKGPNMVIDSITIANGVMKITAHPK